MVNQTWIRETKPPRGRCYVWTGARNNSPSSSVKWSNDTRGDQGNWLVTGADAWDNYFRDPHGMGTANIVVNQTASSAYEDIKVTYGKPDSRFEGGTCARVEGRRTVEGTVTSWLFFGLSLASDLLPPGVVSAKWKTAHSATGGTGRPALAAPTITGTFAVAESPASRGLLAGNLWENDVVEEVWRQGNLSQQVPGTSGGRFQAVIDRAGQNPGMYVAEEVGDILLYPGEYNPDIPFFSGDTPDERHGDRWIRPSTGLVYIWDDATKDFVLDTSVPMGQVIELAAETPARTGLISELSVAGSERIPLSVSGVPERILAGQQVHLVASAGSSDSLVWRWRQVFGPTVTMRTHGKVCSFQAPATIDGADIRLAVYCEAEAGDPPARSNWELVDLTVQPQALVLTQPLGRHEIILPSIAGYDRIPASVWTDGRAPASMGGGAPEWLGRKLLDLGIKTNDVMIAPLSELPTAQPAGAAFVDSETWDVYIWTGEDTAPEDTYLAPRRDAYRFDPITGDVSRWVEDESPAPEPEGPLAELEKIAGPPAIRLLAPPATGESAPTVDAQQGVTSYLAIRALPTSTTNPFALTDPAAPTALNGSLLMQVAVGTAGLIETRTRAQGADGSVYALPGGWANPQGLPPILIFASTYDPAARTITVRRVGGIANSGAFEAAMPPEFVAGRWPSMAASWNAVQAQEALVYSGVHTERQQDNIMAWLATQHWPVD